MSVTAPTDSRVHPPDQLLQPATGAGTAMATGARTGTIPMTMPRARGTGSRATARRIGPRSGRIPVAQACRDLLADAGRELAESLRAPTAAQRYAAAHLAALRAAAAVLASRARPTTGRRASAWDLLTRVAPEFAEWAAFFAAGSAKRQAVQAGIPRIISEREADDMVRQSEEFLGLVRAAVS